MEPEDIGPTPTATPAIIIDHISGEAHIRAWDTHTSDQPVAQILLEDHAPQLVQPGAHITGNLADDVTILVAGKLDVRIGVVDGDLVARRLPGGLNVREVHGDATVDSATGAVSFDRVQGDFAALHIGGPVNVAYVSGDLTIDDALAGATIQRITGGDANFRGVGPVTIDGNIQGDLRVQDAASVQVNGIVNGDVTLANIAACDLREVQGDVTALDIRETLHIAQARGDVRLRDLTATVILPEIQGELAAQGITGGITATCSGEAFLETSLTPGKAYEVTADEIVFRVRSPINAQFVARAEHGEIRTHLPLTVERHRQNLAGVIGRGEATVTLTSAHGDILLDAAGVERDEADSGGKRKRGFEVHIGHGPEGPNINVSGPFFGFGAAGWPFGGDDDMSSNNPKDFSELEKKLQDLGERTGRAARKAAEKAREYADRAAARARETDWDAVSRDIRTAIERTVAELETTFREIVAEFDAPPTTGATGTTGGATQTKSNGPTAQRIVIDKDEPVVDTAPNTAGATGPASDFASGQEDRDAKRRQILEQVRFGDMSLDEAEKRLREL